MFDWRVPTGWTVFSTLWQADGSSAIDNGLYWPFVTVVHKDDSIVIFISYVDVLTHRIMLLCLATIVSGQVRSLGL
jgi:hypothetical protein